MLGSLPARRKREEMTKVAINTNAFVYPMPMTLIGSVVNGKPNFMAVAWVNRVNYQPPMMGVALGRHFTNRGIEEYGEFSVNIPSRDLLMVTDYCGLVSGEKRNKSELFQLFFGQLEHAPMIQACPVTMECRLVRAITLPSNTLFVGEILGAYSEEQYMTDGKPDIQKIQPFTLTMPDNSYWAVGKHVGKAWGSGRDFKPV
jgi:flavin reductase (DIM6/NTAB) family NADH-FMN oxidoreductase RutF